MEIKMGFDPSALKFEDEAFTAFHAGGMTLKFWALYKRNHITNQHFKPFLERLCEYYNDMFDAGSDVKPYTNIDEFNNAICNLGFNPGRNWVVENWDYFNLNIQKKVVLKYKTMVEIEQSLPV